MVKASLKVSALGRYVEKGGISDMVELWKEKIGETLVYFRHGSRADVVVTQQKRNEYNHFQRSFTERENMI